jgi:hypothetical protein
MTDAQTTTDRAAEPVACPECGEADLVQKISAIPDWPAEYGPPKEPRLIDRGVVVLLALGTVLIVLIPFTTGWMGIAGAYLLAYGGQRLLGREVQKAEWKCAMRSRWERLYFCPRDEVAFIPGATLTWPLHEVRDLLCADQEQWADFPPKPEPERFTDFSPMPEEFAHFERMLREAKEKSGTLICFECGHGNPIGQTNCEECSAWVPQTARARWVYGIGK